MSESTFITAYSHFIFKDESKQYLLNLENHFKTKLKLSMLGDVRGDITLFVDLIGQMSRDASIINPPRFLDLIDKEYQTSDEFYIACFEALKSIPHWRRMFRSDSPNQVFNQVIVFALYFLVTELSQADQRFASSFQQFRSRFT